MQSATSLPHRRLRFACSRVLEAKSMDTAQGRLTATLLPSVAMEPASQPLARRQWRCQEQVAMSLSDRSVPART